MLGGSAFPIPGHLDVLPLAGLRVVMPPTVIVGDRPTISDKTPGSTYVANRTTPGARSKEPELVGTGCVVAGEVITVLRPRLFSSVFFEQLGRGHRPRALRSMWVILFPVACYRGKRVFYQSMF